MTTSEILKHGKELNKLHDQYKSAEKPNDKKSKWRTFMASAEEYRKEVQRYIRTNPADISKVL